MCGSTSQTGSTDSQPTLDALTLDKLCDALANQRRRDILQCLTEHQTPMALADLADEIATQEQETLLPDIPAEAVKRVYMSLYHTHIPKLANANIVEYSQDQDEVVLSAAYEHAEFFLEVEGELYG